MSMVTSRIVILAAILGFLAVALGAFGAHALKPILLANGRVDTFELAVRYHFFHTLAILGLAAFAEQKPALRIAAIFFAIGILIFSGSLYVLSITNITWLGAITPVGGVCLLTGWAMLGWSFFKAR
jgi:uncharacterized membrane protein YgdD (TMEM256/DUF423 family)